VYVVPNEGGLPNPAHTYLLTPVAPQGTVAVDSVNHVVYVPISKPSAADSTTKIIDINKISAVGDLGSAAVGAQGATVTANYVFNGDVSPATIALVEGGAPADFVIVGGTCSTSATYHLGDACTATVALKPRAAGLLAGELTMQDALYNGLASNYVHGVGLGGVGSYLMQPYEGTIGSQLMAPQQVAIDALGTVYVADSGLAKVLQYTSNGPISVGKGLTAPTGVAVDGIGNVFIADSGNVIMVPYQNGALNAAAQKVIFTGTGAGAKLVVDREGNIGVADPANQRVLKILYPGKDISLYGQRVIAYSAFTQLAAIGVDANGNLLVADGAKLIRIGDDGSRTTVVDQLAGVTGVAADPSGAVYVSQAGGAIRIPNESGTLTLADKLAVAATVTSPASVAVDRNGNVYLIDQTAHNVHVVTANGAISFGALNLGDAPTLNVDLFNIGNADLTITALTSSNALDFTAAGAAVNGCDSATPVAAGSFCAIAATMNPGAGEEGPLSGIITAEGNAANAPVVLGVSGIGAALAKSSVTITVDPAATYLDAPVTVKVTPNTGTGTPSGTVTVSVGAITVVGTLSAGSVTVHLKMVPGGSQTVTAAYGGDRTYGRSTASATASIGKASSSIELPTDIPAYVLARSNAGVVPSTADSEKYVYSMKVHVGAGAGVPTGSVTFMEGTAPACGGTPIGDSPNTVTLDANGDAYFNSWCLYVDPDRNVPHPVTSHTVTVVYNGDGNYATTKSTTVTFQVLRNPSIMITPSSMSLSVAAGSTASTTLTLTSVAGYGVIGKGQAAHLYDWSGPVDLQCNGLPAHAMCVFNPAQVSDVTDGSPGTTVLTVQTNVPVQSGALRRSGGWMFAAMFGFGLVGLVFGRKSPYSGRVLMFLCALLIVGGSIAGLSGCGGSTASPSSSTAQSSATPSGSYTVNVTIKQSVNQNLVSIPYSFKLTIQ